VARTGLADAAVPGQSGYGPRTHLHWHGRGGYVLAAPSRHPNGSATRWVRGLDLPLPPAPLPQPVMAMRAPEPARLG
jgi:hypothetical protein